MTRDTELTAWVPVARVGGQCAWCKAKITEGRYLPAHAVAACEHDQAWFPHATRCSRYEPEDIDE